MYLSACLSISECVNRSHSFVRFLGHPHCHLRIHGLYEKRKQYQILNAKNNTVSLFVQLLLLLLLLLPSFVCWRRCYNNIDSHHTKYRQIAIWIIHFSLRQLVLDAFMHFHLIKWKQKTEKQSIKIRFLSTITLIFNLVVFWFLFWSSSKHCELYEISVTSIFLLDFNFVFVVFISFLIFSHLFLTLIRWISLLSTIIIFSLRMLNLYTF